MRVLLVCSVSIMLMSAAVTAGAASSPTIQISPSPTYVGNQVTFSGCGYKATQAYDLQVWNASDTILYAEGRNRADASGCISWLGSGGYFIPPTAGIYSAYVYPMSAKASGPGDYGHHKAILDFDFEVLA
jgi:hypothetical protein